MPVSTQGPWFKDEKGRILLWRGLNLPGKYPLSPQPQPTHETQGFYEFRSQVSFIDQPFPLAEAEGHFQRIRRLGFNCVRLGISWEALEHEAPGKYDDAYIDYIIQLLEKAQGCGIKVVINPHQDVWSRFSGGDGAPAWTLELAGFDLTKLSECGAALLHQDDPQDYQQMAWPSNYHKLACATMFTLFFAGHVFAPLLLVEGMSIQQFLQQHFFGAFERLFERIQKAQLQEVILGYNTLNEPSPGLVGYADLTSYPSQPGDIRAGAHPTLFEALQLANGSSLSVTTWKMGVFGPMRMGKAQVNEKKNSAWRERCLWARHGVWDDQSNELLKPDYFTKHPLTLESVDFWTDFWLPFVRDFSVMVKRHHPDALIFLEPGAFERPPCLSQRPDPLDGNLVYAPHWYDFISLIYKRWSKWYSIDALGIKYGIYRFNALALKLGSGNVRKSFAQQLGLIKQVGISNLGQVPLFLGETGISMDLYGGAAYQQRNYTHQTEALDAIFSACEENLISYAVWCYSAYNTHKYGDNYNTEDLSIWSIDEKGNDGIRAIDAVARPLVQAMAAPPKLIRFSIATKTFTLVLDQIDPDLKEKTTEIFFPTHHFPHGLDVQASYGSWEVVAGAEREKGWWLYVHHEGGQNNQKVEIKVIPK